MTSPQDEETKMVKEKAGEEVSVKWKFPCYNQRKAGKTRH